MSIYPALAPALAEQHRRDLTNQASACRLAQTVRLPRPRHQSRRALAIKALRATVAASAIAATAFLVTPAGLGHVPSAHGLWGTHSSWGTSHQTAGSHRAVLAVHWRIHYRAGHRFGAGHHFQADPGSGRWA